MDNILWNSVRECIQNRVGLWDCIHDYEMYGGIWFRDVGQDAFLTGLDLRLGRVLDRMHGTTL